MKECVVGSTVKRLTMVFESKGGLLGDAAYFMCL